MLQQTTNHISITRDDLLSPIKDIPIPFHDHDIDKNKEPESKENINNELCSNSNIQKPHLQLTVPVLKKQGVSGESCDSAVQLSCMEEIQKFDKDFR